MQFILVFFSLFQKLRKFREKRAKYIRPVSYFFRLKSIRLWWSANGASEQNKL